MARLIDTTTLTASAINSGFGGTPASWISWPTRISAALASLACTVPTPPGWPVFHALSRAKALPTLFRQPGMSDACFAADADGVRRDLSALKTLLRR